MELTVELFNSTIKRKSDGGFRTAWPTRSQGKTTQNIRMFVGESSM